MVYALLIAGGAAFPRLAYRAKWYSRLGPRATLLYVGAKPGSSRPVQRRFSRNVTTVLRKRERPGAATSGSRWLAAGSET